MPAFSLSDIDVLHEIAEVENALIDGFPPNTLIGSHDKTALRVAAERLNIDPQSMRRRIGTQERGGAFWTKFRLAVDWSVYRPRQSAAPPEPAAPTPDRPEISPQEHAEARARSLAREITALVTQSRYPLVNPEAIVVESYMSRRYDRETGGYEQVEGTPRTWVSDTLRVAPIEDARGRKFLFTGAQNDAAVHAGFWTNLNAYAAFLGAEIIVGPWTYESSWWSENNPTSREYDGALWGHLCFGQLRVGSNFIFCGEMNTLPTAARPISDLVTYSRGRFAVFPHAKLQLKSVPSTDPSIQAHQVMTTGAVTLPKVIPRKAGVKSIFHHIIGATLVEFDDAGDIFLRQISADESGEFYDLDRLVSGGTVTTGHRVKAVVCGDIHARKLDPANVLATFGMDLATAGVTYLDNVIDTLRPEEIIVHDVFDNESRNHHHVGDSAYSYEMAIRGRDKVMDEVGDAAQFLIGIKRPFATIRVIDSNHDLGLERYVREGRYRSDGANARVGLQLEDAYMAYREQVAAALDKNVTPPTFSLFEHAARGLRGTEMDGIAWVHDGQSFLVDGVECGHHGFRGANGSKGTISGFARIGRKMSIGDKHTPEIMDGVYCAGSLKLNHGYNKGPSSWAVSHVIQYASGKRAVITLQNGKWRAERPRYRVSRSAAAAA